MRTKRVVAGAVATVVAAGVVSVTMTADAETAEPVALAEFLQTTMDGLAFQEVLDLAPPSSTASATAARTAAVDKDAAPRVKALADPEPISQQPQIDATVLELDADGRIAGSATVLMSPQHQQGVVVPVDENHHTTAVRWRQWDDAGWYANRAQGTIDVVPGREGAQFDFMSPYPASVLKLMVTFGVLRLVDQGEIALDDTYAYRPTAISSLCGNASRDTIGNYIDRSLTESSNAATCALVKMMHDHAAVDGLNRQFQELGLETLQLKNTNPANGGRWGNPVTMSSLDTAKLLAVVNGGAGTLWTTPAGEAVSRDVLSDSSRGLFLAALGQQGWNWMLSTPNYCGREYPAAGIPQVVADRWVGADGTVTVAGSAFGQDVRPCNEAAEVTFAHKPGWVGNSGADAGIVKSLPGKAGRHYIVAVFSNLGDQYQDPGRPATPAGTVPVEFTEKFAKLGAAIDRYEAGRAATP
ncbi:serine hydrolase [Actinoplanes sp. NPDC051633]|uniref:serine hydrolase n=1 Tax=Actinoplanes sp. NPDC051633 TaxID=3155670 RepID=UPI0034166CF5